MPARLRGARTGNTVAFVEGARIVRAPRPCLGNVILHKCTKTEHRQHLRQVSTHRLHHVSPPAHNSTVLGEILSPLPLPGMQPASPHHPAVASAAL